MIIASLDKLVVSRCVSYSAFLYVIM